MSLALLRQQVQGCTLCTLADEGRTQPVFGVGRETAPDFMFIGEGPGADEDQRTGQPFTGPAGKELNKMLAKLGYSRDTVFLDNVVKCRPFKNRTPHRKEITTCFNYLEPEIDLISPKVIICVGKPAGRQITGLDLPMYKFTGNWYAYKEIPVRVIYHPAYWLRLKNSKPEEYKRVVWQTWNDMQAAINRVKEIDNGKTRP